MREGLLQSKAFKACFSYTLFSGVSWRVAASKERMSIRHKGDAVDQGPVQSGEGDFVRDQFVLVHPPDVHPCFEQGIAVSG